jgi:hypothetical protein
VRLLLRQARGHAPIEPRDGLLDEGLVVGRRRKLPAAAEHQGLGEGRLERVVGLLGDAVLVRAARVDARRDEPVVRQHRREALGQRTAAGVTEFMGGGREVVRACDFGHTAQRPQRTLQACDQGLVGLSADEHGDEAPAAVGQHELEQQVIEGIPSDRDAELARMCEIDLRLSARHVLLGKEDLSLGPVDGSPVPQPPLQRTQLTDVKLTGTPFLESLEQRRCLEHPARVGHEPHAGRRRGCRQGRSPRATSRPSSTAPASPTASARPSA